MEIVFQRPWALLFALIIPLLIVLHYYFFEHARRRAIKFANFSAMKRVTGTHLLTKNTGQLILRMIIFISLILALAHPILWYEGNASIKDYVIAIDTSSSMLADDVKPDRLSVAKQAASAFLDKVEAYTEIGLVSFAGVSFIKSPLTTEKITLKNKVENIEIQLGGGTDIGGALVASTNMFKEDNKIKTIILITDGSDTAGSFIDESITNALDYVKEKNIIVHTIGIGTGGGKSGYINSTLLTAVYDIETLKRIAELTGGNFYEAKNSQDMTLAFQKILSETVKSKLAYDTSLVLLLNALVLLFLEWTLLNTRFRALP
jgi:Ca-activated chloride channel family protein